MYAHYGAFTFLLDLPPRGVSEDKLLQPCRVARDLNGTPTHSPRAGNMSSGAHQFILPWGVPPAPGELVWLPSLLCAVSPVCCAEAVHWLCCLSGGIALNRGAHLMCSLEEVSSAFCYTIILDPPPYQLIFKPQFNILIITILYPFLRFIGALLF